MDGHKWLHAYKTFSVCIVFFSHIGNSTNSHILLRRAPFIKTTIYVIPNSQLKPSEFGNCCSHGQMELDGMNCMFTGHSKNVTQQGPDSQCEILEGMLLYYRLLCSLRIQLSYLWILVIQLAVDYLYCDRGRWHYSRVDYSLYCQNRHKNIGIQSMPFLIMKCNKKCHYVCMYEKYMRIKI